MQTALVWFRRDLRIHDNPALQAAVNNAERVVPVFIWAPEEEAPWQPGAASRWWLHHSLASLDTSLRKLGSPLVIRRGASLAELRRLVQQTGAGAVYWNRLYEPASIRRDQSVKQTLREQGIAAESFNAALLAEPWELKTGAGDPYRVFTPFWKTSRARAPSRVPLPAPRRLLAPSLKLQSESLESLALLPKIAWDTGFREAWTPGEPAALRALDAFCKDALAAYAAQRDLPAAPGTSRLSPHLHFGEIGPVQAAARIERLLAEKNTAGQAGGAEVFLKELGWREFAHHLLFHFPHTAEQPMDERFRRFPWRRDYAADFRAWQQGHTGFPIVDAGMRELWVTGWMHNRVRMIAASFLIKNLLIPWQEGARWFWDTLVDADLASNTLGWQWTAGSGADAAPYFRIFNPVLQSRKFDPQSAYLRRWLPELGALDPHTIHAPWENGSAPAPYPQPLVDLGASRDRALAAFQRSKAGG